MALAAFAKPCENNSGGAYKLYIADVASVTSATLTSGEWSAITMNGVAVFYEYECEQDTIEFRENVTRENYSTRVDHEIEFYLPKMSTLQRNAIQELIDNSICGILAIVVDSNEKQWFVGYSDNFGSARPLKLVSDTTTTGKAFSDNNGSTILLRSTDNEKSRVFTGTVAV